MIQIKIANSEQDLIKLLQILLIPQDPLPTEVKLVLSINEIDSTFVELLKTHAGLI